MGTTGYLVAIVDDDASVLRALARVVRSLGYATVTYPSGEAFLGALGKRVPSCAILDQCLPGRTGLETLQTLRGSAYRVPAIIVTAHDEIGLAERCLAAGAATLIVKPVDDEALKDALKTACNPEIDFQTDV